MPCVYFINNIAQISFQDKNKVVVHSLDLPENEGGELVFTDEACFRTCFTKILAWYKKQTDSDKDSIEFVIGIPDTYGIIEQTRIFQFARRTRVNVLRLLSLTMACAISIYYKGICKMDFWSAVIRNGSVEIGEYYADDGVIEKKCTCHIIENSSANRGDPKSQYLPDHFSSDRIRSSTILNAYAVGEPEDIDALTRYLLEMREQTNSEELAEIGWKVHPLEEENISAGLAYYFNVIKKNNNTDFDILCLDESGPYDIELCVNQNRITFIEADTAIPTRISRPFTLSCDPNEEESLEIILFEGKERRGQKCYFSDPPRLKIRGGKEYEITVAVDEGRHITIFVKETDGKESYSFTLEDCMGLYSDGAKRRLGSDNSSSLASEALKAFFPVIDNLSYSLKYARQDPDPYAQGMVSIYQQAVKILEKNGITVIGKEGEEFDYRQHNAVDHVNDPSLPQNCIKKVIRPGYRMEHKLLQYADVIVAN